MNSHGSVLHQRTKHGYKGPYDDNPSWSPEGNSIYFERDAPDFSTSAIFLIKPDGSGFSQKLVLPGAKVSCLRQPIFTGRRSARWH